MNKDSYLAKLEDLLIDNNVENTYGILRDYSNKIDEYSKNNINFDDIVKELGHPKDIIKNYVKNENKTEYDYDSHVYENNDARFKKPSFESNSRKVNEEIFENQEQFKDNSNYDNRFKTNTTINSNLIKTILYIVIALMIVSLIFRFISLIFFGTFFTHGAFHGIFSIGLFSFLPTLIIILIVIYILNKNNNE